MNEHSEVAFALTVGARVSWSLKPNYEESLLRPLHRLNSDDSSALAVWSYPAELDFADAEQGDYSTWYLQCAGSAERMTIELREPTSNPPDWLKFNQWVIGKGPVDAAGDPTVEIRWADHSEFVYEPEAFTADEAEAVFLEYVETRTLSDRWHRRLIDSGE